MHSRRAPLAFAVDQLNIHPYFLVTKHRKLKPTGAERFIWGDGYEGAFPVVETPWGVIGPLICWENYMPLARAALYQKGVSIYLAPDTPRYGQAKLSNITPTDWSRLAARIGELMDSVDGVVIIHGTDTMAYTASMLSFMLQNIPIPVVLTGSQMPLGVPMSDAEDNCRCAVRMAACGLGGVYVAFDRKIMLGCRTSKVRTVSFNAFESINYPYIGEVNAFGLQLRSDLPQGRARFQLQNAYSDKIAVLKLFPGMDPEIFSFLQERGYEGVYIEGFGLGGVPFLKGDFTAEIRRASEAGMPILVGSQCRYEGSNLSVYETGQRILECGGIPVHDMTQEAVVTKLMWGLGQLKRREQIQWLFSQNLVGEVSF